MSIKFIRYILSYMFYALMFAFSLFVIVILVEAIYYLFVVGRIHSFDMKLLFLIIFVIGTINIIISSINYFAYKIRKLDKR